MSANVRSRMMTAFFDDSASGRKSTIIDKQQKEQEWAKSKAAKSVCVCSFVFVCVRVLTFCSQTKLKLKPAKPVFERCAKHTQIGEENEREFVHTHGVCHTGNV